MRIIDSITCSIPIDLETVQSAPAEILKNISDCHESLFAKA
jgi:hypothetical protein